MNKKILDEHIKSFITYLEKESEISKVQYQERLDSIEYYKSWTNEKILGMNEENIYEYISKLWAMLIWGNKHYVVNKIILDNGFEGFKQNLAKLVWGNENIEIRWNEFRKTIKGMGPAMISEILCKTHPEKYLLWNRRAYNGLNQLEVKELPVYTYQITGKKYKELSQTVQSIAEELNRFGFQDPTLLAADYFLWHEFPADNLNEVFNLKQAEQKSMSVSLQEDVTEFIHNDVRDAIKNIGQFLGFNAEIEKKVASGAIVDTIWESKVGNMGRVIYVFEVQTKGSIDSLLMNLLKAINNPAVQGIVAVSDKKQIEKIKEEAREIAALKNRLRYWDYEEVLKVYDSLELVNSSINQLNLVPEGF